MFMLNGVNEPVSWSRYQGLGSQEHSWHVQFWDPDVKVLTLVSRPGVLVLVLISRLRLRPDSTAVLWKIYVYCWIQKLDIMQSLLHLCTSV